MKTVDNASNVGKVSNLAHEAIDKVTNATYQVANKIIDDGDELYQVANKIVDKGDELNNLAHETIDKATTATTETLDKLSEKKDKLVNAEEQLVRKCSAYVRDNPISSIGIAIGAGFLLCKLLSSR